MKYAVIILAGAADEPIDELDGKTPLEAARLPSLAHLATIGRVGCAALTREGREPDPASSLLTLLGYNTASCDAAPAPIDANGQGVEIAAGDWVFHMNLVTVGESGEDAGRVIDTASGGIGEQESQALLADLLAHWKQAFPKFAASMRLAEPDFLIDASLADHRATTTFSPLDVLGQTWKSKLPTGGPNAARLGELIESSIAYLSGHEINLARVEQGLRPANLAWVWGGGRSPKLASFRDRLKVRASLIASSRMLQGIAGVTGLEAIPAPAASGGTPLADAITDALRRTDLICCRVHEPHLASLRGDFAAKVTALEAIDAEIIGPVLHSLDESYGNPQHDPNARGWRLLVIADQYTLSQSGSTDSAPVPFVMAGAWVRSAVQRPFTESEALDSDLAIDPGHDLMEYFLRGGLASVRAR